MPTMHARQRRFCLFAAALAGSLAGPPNCPAVAQVVRPVVTPTSSDAAAMTPDERRALEEYKRAWQNYSAAAGAYWNSVAERRQLRNGKRARGERLSVNDYVLAQPPVYTGPPNPLKRPPHPVYVPVVADLLAAERERVQAGLCQSGTRRRSDQRSDRSNLFFRGDWERQLRP